MANSNFKDTPGLYAQIQTKKGNITISLYYEKVPVTVANFVGLAEGVLPNKVKAKGTPYYDGLTFHRCIHTPQPFMIQGGCPEGTGTGGPGYRFGDEFDPTLRFDKPGLLAMANSGPATNGSQFFITEAPTTWLDHKHTIFGEVVEGYDLVPTMQNGEVMNQVSIIRVGKDAEAFDVAATWANKDELLEKKEEEFDAVASEAIKQFTISPEEWVKKDFPNAQKTASGLHYVVLKEGTGEQAVAGQTVSVHYTGLLTNGRRFDSSHDRNQPITFMLGKRQVIEGWEEGIALMKVGAKYKLIIPSKLGYGRQGAGGVIPPNATLIFDTELVSVK